MAVVAQLCTNISNVKSLFLVYVLEHTGKVITRSRRYDFDIQCLKVPKSPYYIYEKTAHSPQLVE